LLLGWNYNEFWLELQHYF